jgi:hypothetical protein
VHESEAMQIVLQSDRGVGRMGLHQASGIAAGPHMPTFQTTSRTRFAQHDKNMQEGGAWCESPDDCVGWWGYRSSLVDPDVLPAGNNAETGYFNRSAPDNVMANWNYVFIRCVRALTACTLAFTHLLSASGRLWPPPAWIVAAGQLVFSDDRVQSTV